MTSFSTSFTARFGDVDPAGIIYFARFFDFFHQALEQYFESVLQIPYAKLVQKERIGVPVVRIEGDFRIPIAFGEVFEVFVRPRKIGNSSIQFAYTIQKPNDKKLCTSFYITHVMTNLDTFKPMPIPEKIRTVLRKQLPEE